MISFKYGGKAYNLTIDILYYEKKFLRRKRLFFHIKLIKAAGPSFKLGFGDSSPNYRSAVVEVDKYGNYLIEFKINSYSSDFSEIKQIRAYDYLQRETGRKKCSKFKSIISSEKFTEDWEEALLKFDNDLNEILIGKYKEFIPDDFTK